VGDVTPGKGDARMENTLGAENTIRTHYLRDKIRGLYYANRHIRQDVSLDGIRGAELGHASPEATLRIMVYARYLFLEIWQSGMLVDPIDEILKREGVERHPQLGWLIEQDPKTAELVEKMRQRFSTHPSFTIKEAMEEMEAIGFERFWLRAQRVLMFKDAVSAVTYTPGALDAAIRDAGKASARPAKSLTVEERHRLEKRYGSPAYDVDWGEGNTRSILQECVACMEVLMDEHRVATALHRCYRTRETMERLVGATYNLKYVILEVYEFIRIYKTLGIPTSPESPTEPELFERKKKYCKYRKRYAAHGEGRVPSVMLIFEDAAFMPELARDVEEIIILSRRLCPGYSPTARIALPTREKADEMDREMEDVRVKSHEMLGDEAMGLEYEKKCDELRGAVAAAYGLR